MVKLLNQKNHIYDELENGGWVTLKISFKTEPSTPCGSALSIGDMGLSGQDLCDHKVWIPAQTPTVKSQAVPIQKISKLSSPLSSKPCKSATVMKQMKVKPSHFERF